MLAHAAYGKSKVRLVQVHRGADRHQLRDLTIGIRFTGQYDESYTEGVNSAVLPTDTMKNTVYALAARDGVAEPETFGLGLAHHFLERNPRLRRVCVNLVEHLWTRIHAGDAEHASAFMRRGPESRTAVVLAGRQRATVRAGISDLVILKSAHSAFAGFMRDEFTTLADTRDRLLVTALSATWRYTNVNIDFGSCWRSVRQILLEQFAIHHSESVQHTLYVMGRAVLDNAESVAAIRLVMPNKHHLPVDVTRWGLENRNEIFVATEEPFGLIEATVVR